MAARSPFPPVAEQLDRIRVGVDELIPEEELVAKLERSRRAAKPLVVKCGYDPTRPDLHVGHTVTLRKLGDFQALLKVEVSALVSPVWRAERLSV